MALWIALLVALILLGLALTVWIVWRSATAESRRSKFSSAKKGQGESSQKFIKTLFKGSQLDSKVWDQLKDALVSADVGVQLAEQLVKGVKSKANSGTKPEEAAQILAEEMCAVFQDNNPLKADKALSIWLIVGVNGSGKTTSIAKLANQEKASGKKVVLAAADTFRAAAADQLGQWSKRLDIGFVRGDRNADPSSVVFDSIEHAKARKSDLVIIDTAGRLHTKVNLMEELKKIKKSAEKAGGDICETLLVIDATTGQNGLNQASQFAEAVGVTGIILSKLDGTAKGGIVLSIAHQMKIPIKRVGVGESIEDLEEFSPAKFVESLIYDV